MAIGRLLTGITLLTILTLGSVEHSSAAASEQVPNEFVFSDSSEHASETIGFHSHAVAEGQITRLYQAYFNRSPDEAGLSYWLRTMTQGSHIEDISGFFANSQEFRLRYGSVSDDEFVALLYRNVLRRTPDDSGLRY